MALPTRGTPFPFRPLRARLVRCWLASVWSVYRRVVVAAGVWLVHGCVGRRMSACSSLGLFCCCEHCRVLGCRVDALWAVGSFVRRPACAQPVMVSHCCLGLAVAGMSDAGFVVLRPGCGRHVALVRRRRSRTQTACRGCVVARIGLASFALVVYGCVVVVLLPALCMAYFVALASSAPLDGRFVLLSGVLGSGGHWWSVAVVWGCTNSVMVGCAALL